MAKTNKKKKRKAQSQENLNCLLPPKKHLSISPLYSTLLLLIPFTLFYIGIYSYIFDSKLDLNGDNADYYILGKALATGKGFRNISEPEQPLATHFPPGYPLIIAAVLKISPDNIAAIKTLNGIFFYGSLVLLFFLLKQFCSTIWIPSIAVMIVSFNAHLLRFSTIMMSEIPFLFFSILSLYLFLKVDFSKNVAKTYQFYLFLFCVVFSYYIKALGLALMTGFLLYLLFRKNVKSMVLVLTGFVIGILPWFIRGQRMGGNSYLYQLFQINVYRPELGNAGIVDFVIRFINNTMRYITREIPYALFPSIPVDYGKNYFAHEWITGLLLLALIIYGIKALIILLVCRTQGSFL